MPAAPSGQFDVYVRLGWGQKVARRRKALNLSQTEAAAQAKMHQGQWSKVEIGTLPISDEVKWRVAAVLDCPIGELFPWPESRPTLSDQPKSAVVFAGEAS